MQKTYIFILALFLTIQISYSQTNVIDKIIGVVGGNILKQSDLEQQYLQYLSQGNTKSSNIKCILFEEMLYQKLLLNQAQLDSIVISDEQAESEVDRRMRYFTEQFGSEKKLEEFYGKSVLELKDEFKQTIKDQLLTQQMESKITEGIKVTPSEVKDFFSKLPIDSIPTVPSEVEVCQIVKRPIITDEARQMAREKITLIRDRILKGEDFATLAVLYSEDPGSARKGGELGSTSRGQLYPEFEAAAFKLKNKEISPIILTKAGYHIIQMIERKGEFINVRHILIQPPITSNDLLLAKQKLDSIHTLISNKTLTFKEAALLFSDDDSKNNGGQILNPSTGNSKFEISQLDASLFFIIDKMQINDISLPVPMKTDDAQQAYRILLLKTRTEPHKANLKTDYDIIQEAALNEKKENAIDQWTKERIKKTYIKIHEDFQKCSYTNNWLN